MKWPASRQLANVPTNRMGNLRNEMYVISESIRLIEKSGHKTQFTADDDKVLTNYKKHLDLATKFIPTWVKVAVAIALGLGTMIGWKRIVVTVGEKIGKDHLTYGQGAAAEITAMVTISTADMLGLPVSTTHVLSSGVAGTMAANHSGLQFATVRNMLMAWVLTLPVAMMLSGFLFWAFRAMSAVKEGRSHGNSGRRTRKNRNWTICWLPIKRLSRSGSRLSAKKRISRCRTIP